MKFKVTPSQIRRLNRIYKHYIPEKNLPNRTDLLLNQWTCYTTIHECKRIDFNFFDKILQKIDHKNLIKDKDAELFWEGVDKILPSCFEEISRLSARKGDLKILEVILSILEKLSELQTAREFQMGSINYYA